MINTDFLNQLDRFHLVVKKRVTSNYMGPRRSIATGRGLTFKEHRMYAPGDDIRLIDWKVFARTDDLYVKTFEEERNLTVHVIMDASASMGFGKPINKFDYASMLGVGFAYLAMKDNEKFQFSTFAEGLDVFQPRRGMSQLASMVYHLNNTKTQGHSKLLDGMVQYKKVIGNRSLLVLISDFLLDIDEVTEALYTLGDHEIKIVQVLDPIEKDLKYSGDFKLTDSETKNKLRTYISPRLRVQYQQMLDNHSAKIEETCNRLGMHFHLLTTDTPIFDAFYRVLE
ncbi:MAG: DUF58 domain-containing protein [Candidatus Woesearchaeota archaeon]|jgi:uncharacterized protein (DUF58 family)|nr:DUF58 domain-containing protein [archaeon]MDP6547671.1 DUF58 domain-containing protein [Candidatus Woesearchaeota archaeon]MDP7263067.1 DUF58 domain-containing protein [Candidatus Woesearchaeota archaeon]MDP7622756.1 DUF58 domain-containing protein [Candidatus Woesearchaeota archaeon]HJN56432.1 DUF58 domain-containing protein [Candidatus Woesearchaeota archaeon]|tara:strand:+ start:34406 stop:35254 length:849 start_codon:yes stop_codon:yes gene_type:complete